MSRKTTDARYALLKEEWGEKGIALDEVARQAMALQIETPSWAYANCGTRFGVVKDPAAPRDAYEKVSDAAQVHKVTGITPAVAVHVLWDSVPDWSDLQRHAVGQGIRIGAKPRFVGEAGDTAIASVLREQRADMSFPER